ncbi:hypothetical protein N7448_009333 [Penicillium atrosanguineum]|uniref:uncharacterized protein n=1 Tax=Penicillium atrosanguineum TaxID=1132637 RepID=UPI00238C15E7|nr:uncharacterized protein N7443_006583 [Penicillium atrosanguineum]KAJ5123236.1 hypothetical protein N7448_009333 [Penicillium atrosanguineum]KAJ5141867.1 hypothetical protein N7526_002862 [Penicillium atrosanguineum]KAJ5298463.1 hypothetical protein N7443_006583 [Penicillium atrosanguineum]
MSPSFYQPFTRSLSSASSLLASKDSNSPSTEDKINTPQSESRSNPEKKPQTSKNNRTVAQSDAELRERLEKMSGEGGAAGIEYEDGQPSAMKRGVRNNMFRLI